MQASSITTIPAARAFSAAIRRSNRCDKFGTSVSRRAEARPTLRMNMQAVVKTNPCDGVSGTEIRDCPVPKPGPGEVLIRVGATAICGTDKHIYRWDASIQDSVKPPYVIGQEFAGAQSLFAGCAVKSHSCLPKRRAIWTSSTSIATAVMTK